MFNILLHLSNYVRKFLSNSSIVTRSGWIGGLIAGLLLGRSGFAPYVKQNYCNTKRDFFLFSAFIKYPGTVTGNRNTNLRLHCNLLHPN